MVSELVRLLSVLAPILGRNIGTFTEMAKGIYCVSSGGITQENISRWTGRFGSYRSLQRLMHSKIAWLQLNLLLLQNYWLDKGRDVNRYILAIDEVVRKKAGNRTHGVSWFYSSIVGQVIRSVSFHAVSLVDTHKERSFALHQIQNIREAKPRASKGGPSVGGKKRGNPPSGVASGSSGPLPEKQANKKAGKEAGKELDKQAVEGPKDIKNEQKAGRKGKKRPVGRPKGSKNKQKPAASGEKKPVDPPKGSKNKKKSVANGEKKPAGRPKGSKNKKNQVEDTPLSIGFRALLDAVCPALCGLGLAIRYVVADGAYGNKACLMAAKTLGLYLVSKLNRTTSLFLPYLGEYQGHGAKKKYGDRLMYGALPKENLRSIKTEDGVKTEIYHFKKVWTRQLPDMINVVIIVKTNIERNTSVHAVLFSSDTELDWEQLIHFYCLRFQIEFNFRDAKQYFGLASFKNIKQISVQNAVGMAFFMGNISLILLEKTKDKYQNQECSIQDLKAMFRAEFYLQTILNTLQVPQKPILTDPRFQHIFTIGAVNIKNKAA